MNIRQAEYLITIAEEGSITYAAKRLFISQPSLSQTLKQIEHDLGAVIFDRSVSPHRITAEGVYILRAARDMLDIQSDLSTRLQRMKSETEGILRLGISTQRSMQIIPYILPSFRKAYPHVTIQLTEKGSATLEELLIKDRIDLAFAAAEPSSQLLEYQLLEKETIGILSGKQTPYLQSHTGQTVSMEELENESFVSLTYGHNVRLIQDSLFHAYGISPRIILETDSFEVAMRVAMEANVCMFCSDIFIDSAARTKGEFLPLQGYENNRHFYACRKKNTSLPLYAEEIIKITGNMLKNSNN